MARDNGVHDRRLWRSLALRTGLMTVAWGAVLVAYVTWFSRLAEYQELVERFRALGESSPVAAIGVYWLVMLAALMLPLSSSALLLLVGLEAFGRTTTFLTGLTAGGVAAGLSYALASRIVALGRPARLARRLETGRHLLSRWPRATWLAVFLARATPNPLYDVWGYAAGALRIPVRAYLVASFLGGILPLALVCFAWPELAREKILDEAATSRSASAAASLRPAATKLLDTPAPERHRRRRDDRGGAE